MTARLGQLRAVLLAACVVAATGCSSDPQAAPAPAPSATSSATSSSSSSSSSPPTPEPLPCVPGAEPFSGAAADELGADRVMAAYCLLADLASEQERTSLALPVGEQDDADLLALRSLLSPRARAGWADLVRTRSPESASAVDGLTLHDVRVVPRGYVGADDPPYVFGTKVGPAVAELVRGGDALALTFTLETALVLEQRGDDSGRHSLLPVRRDATVVLVPRGDAWLIDDWTADFAHDPVRLVGGR